MRYLKSYESIKNYIITADNFEYVITLGKEEIYYKLAKLNEIDNKNYKLKYFTSYQDAKEFVNFLLTIYPKIYNKYNFNILTHDNFKLRLTAKKYNL